jgi:phage tail-like protein
MFLGADRASAIARAGLHPHAPFTREARRIASSGAFAPALSPAGEILWRDGAGHLLRAGLNDTMAESLAAPWPLAQVRHMVVTHTAIWAAGGEPGTLESFDLQGLQRLRVLTLPGTTVIDIAADDRESLLVLVGRGQDYEIVHIDCGGEASTLVTLAPGLDPAQLTYLRSHSRILLLDAQGTRLMGLKRGEADAEWTRSLGAYRTCFVSSGLASDGRSRSFLAGVDGESIPFALVVDADGSLLDCVQLQRAATGIAGGRGSLIVSDERGIGIHFRDTRAGSSAAVSAQLVTPLLRTPEGELSGRWLRAEAWSDLPEGTTLELRYGWNEHVEIDERIRRMLADPRLSEFRRVPALLDTVEHWSTPISYAGNVARDAATRASLSFPLQDARAPNLWLHITLRATPRSALPSLTRLHVLYGNSELLEQLPAIYRRTALNPGDFLGALVGTLEATTQDIDQRIASLGSLVHPDTAPGPWLDKLAEWLGLPWDNALSPSQKLALVRNAGSLASQRGTRAGLNTLLASLFPGNPTPFRISDVDVDFGFVSLGGGKCRGSSLPAVLAGLPARTAVLSRRAILGRACLPARGAPVPSATERLSGRLRIDIAAPAEQQRAARPWLERLIDSITPAHLRVHVRWRTPPRDRDSDGTPLLVTAPQPHLGEDAITGYARLPRSTASTLSEMR